MKWSNLKTMECPKCGNLLHEQKNFKSGELMGYACQYTIGVPGTGCATAFCDFKIGKEKFNEVVNSLYKPKQKTPTQEDNLSDWNNYGREPLYKRGDEN